MANIKGTTVFAQRVKALDLTIVEFAELSGYRKSTLYNYSCGFMAPPPPLLKILDFLEAEKADKSLQIKTAIDTVIKTLQTEKDNLK